MNVFMFGENVHKYIGHFENSSKKYHRTSTKSPITDVASSLWHFDISAKDTAIKSRVLLLKLWNNGGRNLHNLGGEDNYDDVFVFRVFSLQM